MNMLSTPLLSTSCNLLSLYNSMYDGIYSDSTLSSVYTYISNDDTSHTLNLMKQKHTINQVPSDGNCFYHAVSTFYKTNADDLRARVHSVLTHEDLTLMAALRDDEDAWADHVQICACTRLYPDTCLIIVEEQSQTLTLHGNRCGKRIIVLQLHNLHYRPVICNGKNLLKYFKSNRDCVDVSRRRSGKKTFCQWFNKCYL